MQDNNVHVVPLNDLHTHIDSPSCECRPLQHPEHPNLYVHNSYDGRELDERFAEMLGITQPVEYPVDPYQ